MPGHDHPVKLQNLFLEPVQLSPESGKARAGYLRNPLVTWIGDDIEQFLNTLAADRSHNPEFGKMGADYIDHCGLPADEQMTRAMERQTIASASVVSFFCRLTYGFT